MDFPCSVCSAIWRKLERLTWYQWLLTADENDWCCGNNCSLLPHHIIHSLVCCSTPARPACRQKMSSYWCQTGTQKRETIQFREFCQHREKLRFATAVGEGRGFHSVFFIVFVSCLVRTTLIFHSKHWLDTRKKWRFGFFLRKELLRMVLESGGAGQVKQTYHLNSLDLSLMVM